MATSFALERDILFGGVPFDSGEEALHYLESAWERYEGWQYEFRIEGDEIRIYAERAENEEDAATQPFLGFERWIVFGKRCYYVAARAVENPNENTDDAEPQDDVD